jgi:hypothetical protein
MHISLPHALTTRQLDALLNSFPAHKDLVINRMPDIITVKMRDDKILSAAKSPTRALWHVMARPGLITTDLE